MKQSDYKRLSKIIQKERAIIIEKQDGLNLLNMEESIDKAVLNNLSTKLTRKDLQKITSIISHYYNNKKGNIAHHERIKQKTKIYHTIRKCRKKQAKRGKKQ